MIEDRIDQIILIPYVIWIFYCWVGFVYYLIKLGRYLRKNHREKWDYLTYVPPFGPGGSNPLRGLPFLFNKKEDFGDEKVHDLKRSLIKYMLFFIWSVVVGLPSLMLLLPWIKKMIK